MSRRRGWGCTSTTHTPSVPQRPHLATLTAKHVSHIASPCVLLSLRREQTSSDPHPRRLPQSQCIRCRQTPTRRCGLRPNRRSRPAFPRPRSQKCRKNSRRRGRNDLTLQETENRRRRHPSRQQLRRHRSHGSSEALRSLQLHLPLPQTQPLWPHPRPHHGTILPSSPTLPPF